MPLFSLDRKQVGARKPWSYSGARVKRTGADGVLSSGATFTSTTDGDTVYKEYTSMHIPAGQTVTVSNRCKGLVIRCYGDCIIDGTLTMSSRGCQGAGAFFAPHGIDKMFNTLGLQWVSNRGIGATGGSGGARRVSHHAGYQPGNPGSSGSNGACGGGGSGVARGSGDATGTSGAGSAGTTWSGGSGSGAALAHCGNIASGDAGVNGGTGTSAVRRKEWPCNDWYPSLGGGAGNPGGGGIHGGGAGQTGAGGLLILIVEGNLVINGTVHANGSNGGSGHYGGGSITLIHRGILTNTGTVNALGGASVSGGGAGGNGSVRVLKGWVW